MNFKLYSDELAHADQDCIIAGVFKSTEATSQSQAFNNLDSASNGQLSQMLASHDIATVAGKTTWLHHPAGITSPRLLLVGCGVADELDAGNYSKACIAAGKALRNSRASNAVCALPELAVNNRTASWALQTAALDFAHTDYRYTRTKKPGKDASPATDYVAFVSSASEQVLQQASAIAAGVNSARYLGDAPPNLCTPIDLAQHAQQLADSQDKVTAEILDPDAMHELGMHALLAVGKGSVNPPRLIALHYCGGAEGANPYVMVGKGITFDTGGISIKPAANMQQMKYDMCGAASVLGAFEAVVGLNLPLNITCIVAAAENMPDGKAYRPGDVITTMSGKTVEVLNTDAEGRMVLCDALTWSTRLKPAAIVDVATLTGACVVALGHHASAIMSKHDDLAEELFSAGQLTHDRAWQLPLWDDYQQQLDTEFADMRNVGGMPAGSITAGCFLSRFVEDQRWAHLDIAGAAWQWGKNSGCTGRPVRLLTQWLVDRCN